MRDAIPIALVVVLLPATVHRYIAELYNTATRAITPTQ